MKKFLTLLAFVAIALNFSSVASWAEEVKEEVVLPVATTQTAIPAAAVTGDDEAALEAAALADDEKSDAMDEVKAETESKEKKDEKAAVPAAS